MRGRALSGHGHALREVRLSSRGCPVAQPQLGCHRQDVAAVAPQAVEAAAGLRASSSAQVPPNWCRAEAGRSSSRRGAPTLGWNYGEGKPCFTLW